MPKSISILLTENIHPIAKERLEGWGFKVDLIKPALSSDELMERLPHYQVLGIRSKTEIRETVLAKNPHLLTIGCFCIGTNQVDLNIAKKMGIPVFNAPHSNTRSVAELVLAEIVCLSRQLFDRSQLAHQGGWLKSADGSREIRGKTLGIIGYGHIGSQVSVLAEAFGMKVIFFDVIKKLPLGNAQATQSLDELLGNSDFITLHVPSTPATKWMMSAEKIQKIKSGAFLLNLSRGDVVDIAALAQAIKDNKLGGAAVDVFPLEPSSNKDLFKSELQGLPNVILSPHIGGSTEEAQYAIGIEVSNALAAFILEGQTLGAVNFPNIYMPKLAGAHRISNIHRNQPGALGEINQALAAKGANIVGQSLVTDAEMGYTLIDVEGHQDAAELSNAITQQSSRSIRTRPCF